MKTPTEQLALWSDKLRDMSALGLMYSKNIYDREHYQAIQIIAMEMFALVSDEPIEEIETLKSLHFSRPTPIAVADAAVIDTEDRILLIQRADNHMWAMPGGMLEVGETPAEGAIRETLEETGVHCLAKDLVGVFDSRHMGSKNSMHFYTMTFLCEPDSSKEIELATFAHETLGFDWFLETELPDAIDVGHVTRIPKAFEMWRNSGSSYFDSPD